MHEYDHANTSAYENTRIELRVFHVSVFDFGKYVWVLRHLNYTALKLAPVQRTANIIVIIFAYYNAA
jgi:hypothetical protein